MNDYQDVRFLNEDEIVLGCKIVLESDRTVSVGKFINTYARLNHDQELMRKVHARLLENKKYTLSHEVDKYGFPLIKYNNKSYLDRNSIIREILIILITAAISTISTLLLCR